MLMQTIIDRHGFANFRELHRWSIDNPDIFWREAWTDLELAGDPGQRASSGSGFEEKQWFPDARLNIVETLLQGDPLSEVIVELTEDSPRRTLTRGQLTDEVAACAAARKSMDEGLKAQRPGV